jgi:UDP-galactopyranose mutase
MSLSIVHIIGAGLSGATLARLLADKGYSVYIYEMNDHIGGNCYDYFNQYGILVQKYGPHIFHTDKKHVYDFVKRFAKFRPNLIDVLVNIKGTLVDLPINFKSVEKFFPQESTSIKKFIKTTWKHQRAIPIGELLECSHDSTKK